jgi:hypothetical protein
MKKYNLNLKRLVPNFDSNQIENPAENEIFIIEKNNFQQIRAEAKTIFEKRKKDNLEMLKNISSVIEAVKYNKILEAIDYFLLEEVTPVSIS